MLRGPCSYEETPVQSEKRKNKTDFCFVFCVFILLLVYNKCLAIMFRVRMRELFLYFILFFIISFFSYFHLLCFFFVVNISEASKSKTKQKSLFITSLIHTHSPKSRSSSPTLTQYSFYFILFFEVLVLMDVRFIFFVVFNFLVEEPKIYSLKICFISYSFGFII